VCTIPSSQPASQAACQVKWACGLHKSGLGPGLISVVQGLEELDLHQQMCGQRLAENERSARNSVPAAQTNGEQLLSGALCNRRHSCNSSRPGHQRVMRDPDGQVCQYKQHEALLSSASKRALKCPSKELVSFCLTEQSTHRIESYFKINSKSSMRSGNLFI